METLKTHPNLSAPELQDLLADAIGFYHDLQKEYDHVLTENQQLAHEVIELKKQNTVVVADETFAEILPHYQRVCDAGGDATLPEFRIG